MRPQLDVQIHCECSAIEVSLNYHYSSWLVRRDGRCCIGGAISTNIANASFSPVAHELHVVCAYAIVPHQDKEELMATVNTGGQRDSTPLCMKTCEYRPAHATFGNLRLTTRTCSLQSRWMSA